MNVSRIAELLEPFLGPSDGRRLTDAELAKVSAYIDLLLRWNVRINLTAIREPEEIVTRHFGESFFTARHLFPATARVGTAAAADVAQVRLTDIGSGAGFPGIPIKLWAPEISLTLIESNQKKAVFLREVGRALGLADMKLENARAETISSGAFDIVTLRAVERFSEALPEAASLVGPSGRLALLISSAQLQTAESILTDYRWDDRHPVPMSQSRLLLIGTKESK
jgi:16S rRNA (guanine527-N7)-methyltransferase